MSANYPEQTSRFAAASNAPGIKKGEVMLVIQSMSQVDFRQFATGQKTETLYDMAAIIAQLLSERPDARK